MIGSAKVVECFRRPRGRGSIEHATRRTTAAGPHHGHRPGPPRRHLAQRHHAGRPVGGRSTDHPPRHRLHARSTPGADRIRSEAGTATATLSLTIRLAYFPVTEGELVALLLAERVLRQYRGTPFERDLRRRVRAAGRAVARRGLGAARCAGRLPVGFAGRPDRLRPGGLRDPGRGDGEARGGWRSCTGRRAGT